MATAKSTSISDATKKQKHQFSTSQQVARPKGQSSTSRTVSTGSPPIRPAKMSLMIMNTGGTNSGTQATERRKQAIFDVITRLNSSIVMIQEFPWVGIDSRAWSNFSWPQSLQYTGNKDASILFDTTEVIVEEIQQSTLQGILEELVRVGKIEQGFSPIPRMCLRIVQTKGPPNIKFICVSWHGRHNKMRYEDLKKEFVYIIKYVMEISQKKSLPMVLAGDFNVKLIDVEKLVPADLAIHKYKPTKRRDAQSVIDFYITSKSLFLEDMEAVNINKKTSVDGVLGLFDHDPVTTQMTVRSTRH